MHHLFRSLRMNTKSNKQVITDTVKADRAVREKTLASTTHPIIQIQANARQQTWTLPSYIEVNPSPHTNIITPLQHQAPSDRNRKERRHVPGVGTPASHHHAPYVI